MRTFFVIVLSFLVLGPLTALAAENSGFGESFSNTAPTALEGSADPTTTFANEDDMMQFLNSIVPAAGGDEPTETPIENPAQETPAIPARPFENGNTPVQSLEIPEDIRAKSF